MLTTGDKWGLGVGAAVLAGVGYELWNNAQKTQTLIKDFSANNGKVISGYNYKAVVNLANGYNVDVNGVHYFVFGTYPEGTTTFTPATLTKSGNVYVYPHGSTPGTYTTVSQLASQGITV